MEPVAKLSVGIIPKLSDKFYGVIINPSSTFYNMFLGEFRLDALIECEKGNKKQYKRTHSVATFF